MTRIHVLKLALRYLRTKWVVYISVLAIAVTVAGVIYVMALMNWLIGMNRRNIRGTLSDVTIRTDDFRGFGDVEALRRAVLEVEGVEEAAAVLEIKAVASNPHTGRTTACTAIGIEMDRMERVMNFARFTHADEVRWRTIRRSFADPPAVVAPALVGSQLAGRLGVPRGAEFAVWTPTSFASDNDQRLETVATMQSNSLEFDQGTIYIPLETARVFREMPERASGLMIDVDDSADPYAVRDALGALLEERGLTKLSAHTWEDLRRGHLEAMDAEGLVLNLMLMLFLVLAVFSVTAIFWMIVLSKARDIGILRAVGASAGSVAGVFVVFGLLVGVVAGGIGFAAGHNIAAHWEPFRLWVENTLARVGIEVSLMLYDPELYYIESTRLDADLARNLAVYAATVLLCGAAGILPSLKAARTNTIETIKG